MNNGGIKDDKKKDPQLPIDLGSGDASPEKDGEEDAPENVLDDANAQPSQEEPSPLAFLEEEPGAVEQTSEDEVEKEEEDEEPAEPQEDSLPDFVKPRTKVRLENVEDALAAAEEKRETREARKLEAPEAEGRKGLSLVFTVLLLAVMAVSVAAGHHFRSHQGVAYYVKRLKSEDPGVQNHARDSLSRFGAVAVPSLKKLIESEDERVALAAVDTLALIGSGDSIELLMELTTHANANIRKRALSALGEHGAPQAFANVVEQISSDDHETRLCAIEALGNENFSSQKAVPVLLELLDDKDWQVRNAAAKVLITITGQNLGTPKSTFTPAMNQIIRDRWRDWWEENGPVFKRPK